MLNSRVLAYSAGTVAFIVLAGWAGRSDYEDAQRSERAYCEQVQLYMDTQGQMGWPDYRDLYTTMCVPLNEKNQMISNT